MSRSVPIYGHLLQADKSSYIKDDKSASYEITGALL
jgi:hypothetical protein